MFNLIFMNLLVLLAGKFSTCQEDCSQLLILSILDFTCSNSTNSNGSTDYKIACDIPPATNRNLTLLNLIQIRAVDQVYINTQFIRSLSIQNQQSLHGFLHGVLFQWLHVFFELMQHQWAIWWKVMMSRW